MRYVFIPAKQIGGNRLEFLSDGPEVFDRLFRAIDGAQSEIALEIYMFKDDATGRDVMEALVRAARRGVRVLVIYDDVGSLFTESSFFEPLRQAGGKVVRYHSISLAHSAWGWAKRDHRKMLVTDQDVVIIGGLNIADEYRHPTAEGGYHDLAVEVDGPAALLAWNLFCRTWRRATLRRFRPRSLRREVSELKGSQGVEIVGNDHFLERWRIRRRILYAFSQAREEIAITNPYFLPDPAILHALIRAARKGVRVRLILPTRTDVGLFDLASTVVVHRLVKKGIEVYRWPGFAHAKAIVVDGSWISVGSVNFDYRSLFHNLEVAVQSEDEASGRRLREILEADIRVSRRIGEAEWKEMSFFVRWMARLLYRLRAFL